MSLGLLVGRFGDFVGELAPPEQQDTASEDRFPAGLGRVRETFGHHIVPLLLLAKSDGEIALVEREAILSYCVVLSKSAGVPLTALERAALSDYLREFRPTQAQLKPALKRLHHENKDGILALVEAAHAVVDADGICRMSEVEFLTALKKDLQAL
jgi:tellurite resistance protein